MSHNISRNVRFVLWRQGVDRAEWVAWLLQRASLDRVRAGELVHCELADSQIGAEVLGELARAFDQEAELLRFSDFAADSVNILLENLRFLFNSVGHGGKKLFAEKQSVDPTTVSRWLKGAYEPTGPSLLQIASYFGLPTGTDLRVEPVFLSVEPVAVGERRKWVQTRVDALSAEEFGELYPALRRMLAKR